MSRRSVRWSAVAALAAVSVALSSCDSGNVQGSVSVGMYYGTSFYDPWNYGPGYGYGGYYPPGGAVITPVPPGGAGGVRPPGGGSNRPVATPLPSTRPAGGMGGGGGGGGRRR